MGLRSGLLNLGPPRRCVADLAAPIQLAPAAQQSKIKSAHQPPRSYRGQPVEAPQLEVMAVTAFVNARMILMSASLQPWLRHASGPRQYLMLFLLTDANWLLGMRYRQDSGRDLGIYLGSGLALWVAWVAATLPGFLAGALVPDPRRFGLDLLMPLFFSA